VLGHACVACGFLNPAAARFCGGCGQRLDKATAEAGQSPVFPAASSTARAAESGRAERRQLTVLFADLMESTALSEQLDPEVLRRVLRAYQEACVEETRRWEGYLAQYLGDGVLIFFGYPVAHEDGARRAVRTALGILSRLEAINRAFHPELGLELGVRIGLHTGTVVVEHVVGEGLQTPMATGETPNIAARVQALATRNTAVLTADTYRLVAPFVSCADLGPHALKGLARPVRLYQLLGESGATTRKDAAAGGLTPLVGRQSELARLEELWRDAVAGRPRWVLLSGEPGIGKSRLVETLVRSIDLAETPVLDCQCSAYRQNSAFAPITEMIVRRLGLADPEPLESRLARLESRLTAHGLPAAETVPLLAPLLDLPVGERYPGLELTPPRRRQKTLEALTAWLLAAACQRPVLFVVEDLHWADPSTLELLGLILQTTGPHRLLTVLTCRPEFQPSWPVGEQGRVWTLGRLEDDEVVRLVTEVASGQPLPLPVLREIVERTDGVPLFVEELTKMILESDLVEKVGGEVRLRRALPRQAIPVTIQDSLMARLDRLGTAKPLAQWGAVLGRVFRQDVLEAVAGPASADIARDLDRLVTAGLLARTGTGTPATYVFKHALVQDAAYQSLLKATRREQHRRVGETLERQFPDVAATQPELLAHHFTEAGEPLPAITHGYRAGEAALARSANQEAASHFRRGLELLAGLPASPELVPLELKYQLALGNVILALQGYAAPEVGRTFGRARELCLQLGALPQLGPAVYGLWAYSIVRCEYDNSTALAGQLMKMARETGDPELELEAEAAAGINCFWAQADLSQARRHLERAIALYDRERHRAHALIYGQDPGVIVTAHLVWTLYIQGHPEQAMARVADLRRLSRARGHAYSIGYALAWENTLWFLARRAQAALRASAEASEFCAEHGFPLWQIVASYVGAWARAVRGGRPGAAHEIRQVLAAWQATGATVSQAYQTSVLAEVHRLRGDVTAGLQAIDEALALTQSCGDRWYRPELLRMRGELLLAQAEDRGEAAERCLRESLDLARAMGARMWELRAAVSLGQLWFRQDRADEARRLLESVRAGFTEGFAEPEFEAAGRLLAGAEALPAAP
jgi:class 3 adenylate cyclase/predicted ATPase